MSRGKRFKRGGRATSRRPAGTPADPARSGFWREARAVFGLCLLSAMLMSTISAPISLWPLAFVCLTPWTYAAYTASRPTLFHLLSYLFGTLYFLVNLYWLWPVTDLGLGALAIYLGFYWMLAGWAVRSGWRRGLPAALVLPVVWVACEFLRAFVMTGFPWLFVGHAFYEQLWLIQISDITGAYGVSFVALAVNGALADWLVCRRARPTHALLRRRMTCGVSIAVVMLIATIGYGVFRTRTADFSKGPRVAVVQHDFLLYSDPGANAEPWLVFAAYLKLAAEAAQEGPDLLVFPETTWSAIQNTDFFSAGVQAVAGVAPWMSVYGKKCDEAIAAFARGEYAAANRVLDYLDRQFAPKLDLPRLQFSGGPATTVVLGALSLEVFPERAYPKSERYNSVLIYEPDGKQRAERYDKVHLVPFGESVPFRYGKFHWLYLRLNALSPFSGAGGEIEYSLTPGEEMTVFELETGAGKTRFGTPICYEDAMPYLIRNYVWNGAERRVDFLVSVSNDGWFLHSSELPQHLAICAFRAVENRVGIARSVNTGMSGFIDPNGRIYSLVEKNGRTHGPGVVGYSVDHVLIDKRGSLYGRFGDWFATFCLLVAGVLWVDAIIFRRLQRLRAKMTSGPGRAARLE